MATIKLTEKTVAAMPAPTDAAQAYVWDTELRGFGVVIGKTGVRTYVVRGRVAGALIKRTIGQAGRPRGDGNVWTVILARQEARKLLGGMADGKDPIDERRRARATGPTLRDGMKLHLENMRTGKNRRRKVCSPRSIHKIETEVPRHLGEWLDRPIVELTADELERVCDRIRATTARLAGSVNEPGVVTANKTIAHVSVIWNALDKRGDLPGKNPAKRLMLAATKPKTVRVNEGEFVNWFEKVQALANPVRRDLQMVALFTAVRTDGLRNLEWDDVDFEADLLHVRKAKGDQPYTLPMTRTVRDILERRREENRALFGYLGGDHGNVFPSVSRDGKRVQPVAEVKERKTVKNELGERTRVRHLPGIHASRRTFNSVAIEIGVPTEARLALMSHEGKGVNAKHYAQPQTWSHLRLEAERIEAALWSRLRPTSTPGRRHVQATLKSA